MTYSSDEIEGKVSQLVQGSSSFTQDGLGGRNTKERFQDTRELVDSVLLYEPDSFYYLVYKAAVRARSLLSSVLSTMDDLEEDINEMSISARPVADTTGFSDATTALTTISNALARRGSISSAEYNRYDKAVNRILTRYKESVKRTYTPFGGSQATTDIVRSSAEAVTSLNTNFSSFVSAYNTLLSTVDRMLESESDYDHTEVIRSVASRQMSRIKSEMDTLEEAFDSSTPSERAKTARDDTLTVLSNRSAVKALANVRSPGDPKVEQSSTGSSTYKALAYGTGTAPSITGTVTAPWPILGTSELSVDFNATDPTVVVPLVPSPSSVPGIRAATITGANAEYTGVSFAINESVATPWPFRSGTVATGGTYTTLDNYFYLIVDGNLIRISDDLPDPFTANKNATDLASTINSVAGSYVTATPQTNGSVDWIEIEYDVAIPPTLYGNRYMQIASGPYNVPDLGAWQVMVGSPAVNYPAELTAGWDGNDELWVWPNDSTEANAVKIDITNGTWPDYVVNASTVEAAIDAGATGFQASVDNGRIVLTSTQSGEGSILRVIAEDYSTRKSPSYLGMETLGFFEGQEDRAYDVDGQAIVDVLNDNADFSAAATAELLKESIYASKKAYGSSSDEISIDVDADPSTGWNLSSVKLTISAGENEGVYGISSTSYGSGTLDIQLDRNLRDTSEDGLRIEVYQELLKITALDSGTSSYIDVDQTNPNTAHTILGLTEDLTRGTVNQLLVQYNHPIQGWVASDLTGYGVKVGDVVLEEDGTLVTTVTGIDSISSGILDVEAIDPTTSLTSFSIQSVSADNHSAFITSMGSWRDSLTSDEEELTELTRSVNFLLLNTNPPRGRVQAAATDLQAVRDLLEGTTALSGILESFTVPSIDAVDSALQTMSENGHDRARDLLTDAKFSDYQATNYKTASRSGAMMEAASKVAANDLIEPTKTRPETIGEISRLVSTQFDEIDPKYNFGDIRSGPTPINLDYFSAVVPSDK